MQPGQMAGLFCEMAVFRYFCVVMGKTYFGKKDLRRRKALYDELRQRVIAEHNLPEYEASLSTLGDQQDIIGDAGHVLSRHPRGTKAEGLRKDYSGQRVHYSRNRFGEVEEKSSRMRRLRRGVKHSARLRGKRELENNLNQCLSDNDMEKEMKFCQSCGMPLTDQVMGTNADGSKNEDYCIYCYKDGKFTTDCTMEEMIEQCAQFIDEVNKNLPKPITKEEYIEQMRMYFPQLKRWR